MLSADLYAACVHYCFGTQFRVTTCPEKLEMSEFDRCREMYMNLVKARELSGQLSCQGKCVVEYEWFIILLSAAYLHCCE